MFIEVHTTCCSEQEAKNIAKIMVEKKLCACAHIIPVKSLYWWNDTIHDGIEWRVFFKTISSMYSKVEEVIKKEHSYDLPAIYSTQMIEVEEKYKEWIENCIFVK